MFLPKDSGNHRLTKVDKTTEILEEEEENISYIEGEEELERSTIELPDEGT